MSTITNITFEDWESKFQPVVNFLVTDASFADEDGRGIMFETYGIENLYVQNHIHENRVWTWIDGDKGSYVINGYHYVNRIGYFVTEVPYNAEDVYEVLVDTYNKEKQQ